MSAARALAGYFACLLALGGCAHQQIVQQPVACITERVQRDPTYVTNDRLKRVDAGKHPDRFIALAGARINQDAGYISQLEAQVEGCSQIK